MVSAINCAKCCTVFSITGIVFLVLIGILLEYQPLYVKGIVEPSKSAQSCYQGAVIYAGTLLLSLGYWSFDESRKRLARQAERNKPKNQKIKFGSKYGAVAN